MPKPKTNIKKRLRVTMANTRSRLRVARIRVRTALNRGTFANIFMLCFIILTSIGAGMIFFPAGWIVAGVSCGVFGFLLGAE
jgi:hypothetical protein